MTKTIRSLLVLPNRLFQVCFCSEASWAWQLGEQGSTVRGSNVPASQHANPLQVLQATAYKGVVAAQYAAEIPPRHRVDALDTAAFEPAWFTLPSR